MKSRNLLVLLFMTLMLVSITGCKKGDTPPQETTSANMSVLATFNEDNVYTIGDTIVINDIITTPTESAGVTDMTFYFSDGTMTKSFECTSVGEFQCTVILQFSDGSSSNTPYNYIVEEKKIELSETMLSVLKDKNWTKEYVQTIAKIAGEYDITDSAYEMSYSELVEMNGFEEALGMYFSPTIKYEKDVWASAYITSEIEEYLTSINYSPKHSVPEYTMIFNFIKTMIDEVENIEPKPVEPTEVETETTDTTVEETEVVTQQETDPLIMLSYFEKLLKESYTVEIVDTEYKVHDEAGNEYPLKALKVVIDYSKIGQGTFEYISRYIVEFEDDSYLLLSLIGDSTYDYEQDVTVTGPEDITEPAEGETVVLNSYEEFCSYIANNEDSKEYFENIIDTYYHTEYPEKMTVRLLDNIVLGDYSKLKALVIKEDAIEKPEEEYVPQKPVIPSYAEQFPMIYRWPKSDTKYRRWYFLIDETVSYLGSITLPDGTTLNKEDIFDYNPQDILNKNNENETSTGESTTTPGGAIPEETTDGNPTTKLTTTLSSQNGNYTVDIGKNNSDVEIDTDNTTASRVVLEDNNGVRFYIESCRRSQINNYQSTSIYSTRDFKNGQYGIAECNNSEKVKTELGEITLFRIYYKDKNDNDKVSPYMAVYNINGDYLVAYSDKLQSDDSIFINMLESYIK